MRSQFASVATGVALVAAAGCSGGGTPSTVVPSSAVVPLAVSRSGALSPVPFGIDRAPRHRLNLRAVSDASVGFLYVGQFSATPVQEYHLTNVKNKPPLCSLPGQGVNGIAVDQSGNLWVPNGTGGGQGYTQEYAPHCGAAMLQIADSNGQPADAAFDRHHNIYILNIFGVSGKPGSIDVYDHTGNALRTLSDPSFNELIGIGIDAHDNAFVSNRTSSGSATVEEFPHGKMPGMVLGGIQLGLPGAPQLDRNDNLIITDWNSYTLNVYAPPYTASPTITPMVGLSLWCPLDRAQTHLYCADLGGSVDVYRYPGGAYDYSFTNGLTPSGFATGSAPDPTTRL